MPIIILRNIEILFNLKWKEPHIAGTIANVVAPRKNTTSIRSLNKIAKNIPKNPINIESMKKGILYTPYEQADVKARLLKCGFEIVEEKVSGNAYNVLVKKGSR